MASEGTSEAKPWRALPRDPVMIALTLLVIVTMPSQRRVAGPLTLSDACLLLAFGYLVLMTIVQRLMRRADAPRLVIPPAPFWIVIVVVALCGVRILASIPDERKAAEGERDALAAEYAEAGITDQESVDAAIKESVPDVDTQAKERVKALAKETVQSIEFFVIAPFVLLNGLASAGAIRKGIGLWAGMTVLVVLHAGSQAFVGEGGDPMGVKSLFDSRMVLSGYLAMSVPLLWGLAMADWRLWLRVGLVAAAVLGLLAMPSFGGFWGAAVGMAAAALALPGGASCRVGRLLAVAVVLIVAFQTAPYHQEFRTQGVALREVREGAEAGELSISRKYSEWQAAYNLMVNMDGERALGSNFVLGFGPGRYNTIDTFGGFLDVGKVEAESENQYLVIGVTLGFSGVLALAILLGSGIRGAARALRRGVEYADAGIAAGLLGSIVGTAVVSFYTTPIVRGVGVTLLLLLCAAMALPEADTDTEPSRGPRV